MFDGTIIGEIMKDKSQQNIEISILSIQTALRQLAYNSQGLIVFVSDEERAEVNQELLKEVLIPEGYYSAADALAQAAVVNPSVGRNVYQSTNRLGYSNNYSNIGGMSVNNNVNPDFNAYRKRPRMG